MVELGYKLSSEEHGPSALVEYAKRAEEVGFGHAMISDHYHPWVDQQGESPFVWAPIGAIAEATDELTLGTGVTCPTIRIHPAIMAQAAATAECMMPGRFVFGVGTGENLNEHVLGDRWPPHNVRLEMLAEAIDIMRGMWEGGMYSHHGKHFTVENARIYTLPEEPPPIAIGAGGPKTASFAGDYGDAFVGTSPKEEGIEIFEEKGDADRPKYGEVNVCYAESEEEARELAHEWWPNSALKGELSQQLPVPAHFKQAAQMVDEDDVAETVVCGPDPEAHVEEIEKYAEAGYDHVYVHQVGPDQEGFMEFYVDEILPKFEW